MWAAAWGATPDPDMYQIYFSGMDGKVLNFGDKVLLAGYYYNGRNKPCYFGAAYEFLTDYHTCEGMIGLRAASGVEFEDDGHAIA